MRKLLVSILVGLMLVIFGVIAGIKKEVNSNNVQAVQCSSIGYDYENISKYIPTYYTDYFEEHIWNIYIEDYCVNYCGTCDSYYYGHCLCCDCDSDEECSELDYQLFIDDNMEVIADEYMKLLTDIQKDDESYELYSF